jgi:GNAT superfamily N-acetyltransferase
MSAAAPLQELEVSAVRTTAERDAFVAFVQDHYRGDPNFVPPILVERRDFLDPRKNPFLRHARVELFLARRHRNLVGRVAAIDNPHYNQFHNTQVGFFGMFETVDDPAVAGALLDAAQGWVKGQGHKAMLGPMNLSTNHECGLLVEGFEYPPSMMMPYNPAYYAGLLEANGFRKAKDLWAWELSTAVAPPEKVVRAAERVRAQEGVTLRPLSLEHFSRDLRTIKSIYNAMLERNWGYVPMSEEEFDFLAQRFRPLTLLRSELCFIAEVKGEPVAFSITLPDANVGLKAAGGRLTSFGVPIGLARLAWKTRANDRLRVLMLGIKPGFQKRGVDAALYIETLRVARKLGYSGGELGWTLEDHDLMNRSIESMGARRYKTYRIYDRKM